MTTYAEALYALADELRALAQERPLDVVRRAGVLADPRQEEGLARRMVHVRQLAARVAVEESGLSQYAMAKALGIGEQTLSRLLTGHRKSRAKVDTIVV
jgi:DNA-binding XRE family transcriptional regulator